MNPNEFPELRSFFNEKEQIIAMPAKRKKLLLAVYYLSDKIESGRDYMESEINDLLDEWTTFHDPAILRRELYNTCLLERTTDCRRYWKAENIPPLAEYMAKYTWTKQGHQLAGGSCAFL